jgi:hypothetical protein
MTAIGCTGARDKDGIQRSVLNWPGCLKYNEAGVGPVGCSSNMTTGSRWITLTVTTEIRAMRICKRSMGTATMRKRGSKGTISRQVCVTSIKILRSGVRRKFHAPLWSSGRRGDPCTDCNRLNLDIRQRVAAIGRRANTLCQGEEGLLDRLVLFQTYHNFVLPHASLRQPFRVPEATNGSCSAKVWQPCTPAMAAGLTDHVWSLREVLLFRVTPWPQPQVR